MVNNNNLESPVLDQSVIVFQNNRSALDLELTRGISDVAYESFKNDDTLQPFQITQIEYNKNIERIESERIAAIENSKKGNALTVLALVTAFII